VGLRDIASLSQQQRHGVFGCRDDVGLRCIHHHHAPLGRGSHVHIVETDAGAAHHDQVATRCQHLIGDLRRRTNNQCMSTVDCVHKL